MSNLFDYPWNGRWWRVDSEHLDFLIDSILDHSKRNTISNMYLDKHPKYSRGKKVLSALQDNIKSEKML